MTFGASIRVYVHSTSRKECCVIWIYSQLNCSSMMRQTGNVTGVQSITASCSNIETTATLSNLPAFVSFLCRAVIPEVLISSSQDVEFGRSTGQHTNFDRCFKTTVSYLRSYWSRLSDCLMTQVIVLHQTSS